MISAASLALTLSI